MLKVGVHLLRDTARLSRRGDSLVILEGEEGDSLVVYIEGKGILEGNPSLRWFALPSTSTMTSILVRGTLAVPFSCTLSMVKGTLRVLKGTLCVLKGVVSGYSSTGLYYALPGYSDYASSGYLEYCDYPTDLTARVARLSPGSFRLPGHPCSKHPCCVLLAHSSVLCV